MNKNSIVAFVLIIATVALFSSPQYNKFLYEKILKKPYPDKIQNSRESTSPDIEKKEVNSAIKEEKTDNITQEINVDSNTIEQVIIVNDTVWLENDNIKVGIEKIGASIISIKMKNYKYYDTKEEIELMDDIEKGGALITIDGYSYKNDFFEQLGNGVIINENSKKIIFQNIKDNEKVTKEFEIWDDYKIGIKFHKSGLSGKRIKLEWNGGIVESEDDKKSNKKNAQKEIRKAHYYNGDNVQSIKMDKVGSESSTGNFKWVGITSKYFMIAIVSDSLADADVSITGVYKDDESKKDKSNINYQFSFEKTVDGNEANYWIYAGPSKYEELKKYGLKFENSLFPVTNFMRNILGADKWFPAISEFILWTLLALFKIFKDYGISILLLTLLSKIITYPLTYSSMKSMSRTKDIQPKIESIRKKNKNNPKKLNEELMALYKEEGINPLNPGCLPMFLQMPIFIALFVVLKKAIELRGATTILMPWIGDLSKPEAIFTLGTPLPMYGDNVAIMPIVMGVVTFFQNKMTIKDPNQKAMIYIMPLFMLVLFNSFPAGLVLYWTFSSTLALVQQIITEKMKKKT